MRRAAAVLALVLAGAARADDLAPKDAGGAQARPVPFQVRKQLSLVARWTQPSFYADPAPKLLDRGRMLYLGRGTMHGPEFVYLVDVKRLEERMLEAPTTAFAAEHPELALSPVVEDLPCYDRADGQAAVLLKEAAGKRWYVAWWDLKENRLTGALRVGEKGPSTNWVSVRSIGYDAAKRECLLGVERSVGRGFPSSVVAVGEAAVREIASFQGEFSASHGPYYDAAHQRAVVTEVTEAPGAQPHGYLVDLTNGGVQPFPIPQDVYSFTFDPDGRTLYAYGVMARELWAINAATGAVTRRIRLGDIGHALGWVGDALAVVGNVRIHLLDRQTLGHRGQVFSQKLVSGLVNLENSVVLPDGTLALDNFSTLTFVRLEP